MRLFKHKNGYWYYEIHRHKPRSLKTKDKIVAKKAYRILEKELALISIYKTVFLELKKAKYELENHYDRILAMIENSPHLPFFNNEEAAKGFETEESMQQSLLPSIATQFGLKKISEYHKCESGILDVLCECDNKKIIIEFKLNNLSERYLGQCLRYLKDNSISADELWLVGESGDRTTLIYNGFEQIKVFVTTKSPAAKKKIKPFVFKM